MVNYNFIAGRTGGFPTAPPTVLVLQETDPAFRYGGNGSWVAETPPVYAGGTGKYNITDGAWYETTVPAGFTRMEYAGLANVNGGYFDVYKNGAPAGSGTMYHPGGNFIDVYYSAVCVEGDVFRLVKTGGTALNADQVTFSN